MPTVSPLWFFMALILVYFLLSLIVGVLVAVCAFVVYLKAVVSAKNA